MEFKTHWKKITLVSALAAVLGGCQQDESPTQAKQPERKPDLVGYQAEARALKGKVPFSEYDRKLVELQKRYGLETSSLPGPVTEPPAEMGLAKTAATTLTGSVNAHWTYRGIYFVSYVHPGDHVQGEANAYDGGDPVIALIQFDNAGFKSSGTVPYTGQQRFRVLCWNDDRTDIPGSLSSYMDCHIPSGVTGYVLGLVMPYSNASGGKHAYIFGQNYGSCDTCWGYADASQPEPLYGSVFRGAKGNDFGTTATQGDPVTFVFKLNAGFGYYNDDFISGSVDSRVYNPNTISITDAEAADPYNFALVSDYYAGGNTKGTYTQAWQTSSKP